MNLFRRRSLDQIHSELAEESGVRLKRTLGAFDLVSLGIGAIIGAGLFALIGTASAGGPSHLGAGPAVSLSFLLTAVACVFCAFCYAEFAALVPISGSAYTYSYATLGELVAWIIGWDLVLEYAVGSVAVSIGWAGYFRQLFLGLGFPIPSWLCVDYRSAHQAAQAIASAGAALPASFALPYEGWLSPVGVVATLFKSRNLALPLDAWLNHPQVGNLPVIFNIVATIIIMAITWLLVVGIKESARVNNFLVGLKLVILVFFIAVGAFYVKPENWSPFMPNGFTGVWVGASMIFFAFIGFDAVSTAAEECKNPGRDLPIGIIGSLVICTILYVITALVLTGMQPWHELGVADPLAAAFARLGLHWIAGVVSLGAVVAMGAVILVLQLGQTRVFFAMARDGLLPQFLAKVHPKYHTPHVITIAIGLLVALVAGATNINEIAELTNIGTLFAFVLVNGGIIILRKTHPEFPRVFRTPLVPWVPLLGMVMCFYLMLGLPLITWLRFFAWLMIGLVIYFLYGQRHSTLNRNPAAKPPTSAAPAK
jgi:APA family basic amino acid/polyamine antiporter